MFNSNNDNLNLQNILLKYNIKNYEKYQNIYNKKNKLNNIKSIKNYDNILNQRITTYNKNIKSFLI